MELKGLLAALRSEREQIDQAILALEAGAKLNTERTEGLRASVIAIRGAKEPEHPDNSAA
jgi:hypothetical protein